MRFMRMKWFIPMLALSLGVVAQQSSSGPGARAPHAAAVAAATATPRTPSPALAPSRLAAAEPPGIGRVLAPLLDPQASDEALRFVTKPVYFALVNLIRARPELLAELEAMLADADPAALFVQVSVGALAGAGTPESQASLVRLLAMRPDDPAFMKRVVPALGFAKHPTPELERAIRGLAEQGAGDVARLANLGMGVLAAHAATAEPARAARIVAEYEAKLGGAGGDDEIRGHLSVLGNAGTADAARVVERYLASASPRVRSQAVEALRRVPTERAERSMLDLLGDEHARVRASAAWALGHRRPTARAVAAQASLLARETDERVAEALLRNLWAAVESDRSAVLAALADTARAHPLDAIRDQARGLLEGRG